MPPKQNREAAGVVLMLLSTVIRSGRIAAEGCRELTACLVKPKSPGHDCSARPEGSEIKLAFDGAATDGSPARNRPEDVLYRANKRDAEKSKFEPGDVVASVSWSVRHRLAATLPHSSRTRRPARIPSDLLSIFPC